MTVEAELYEGYKLARHTLRAKMCESKHRAYIESVEALNLDPWGRMYIEVKSG